MRVPEIHILDDFGPQAARRFVECCTDMISQRERIHVGLTGGQTAREFYEALARPGNLRGLNVRAIDFYEGDERLVPPSSPDSDWGMAAATFLDPAGVPEENRHRMRAEADDLDAAAAEYEALLCSRLPRAGSTPSFDLLMLGMGANGHTASLFPGTAALGETVRLVVPNPVPQLNVTRLTATYPLINASRAVWIIASGVKKAEAVQRVLEHRDPSLPATHVAPTDGPLVWLLDEAAASLLSPEFSKSIRAGS